MMCAEVSFTIIDTFPDFLTVWPSLHGHPIESQIDVWACHYMAKWPELLTKQQEDYPVITWATR